MPKPFDDQVTLELLHACDDEGLRSERIAQVVDKNGKRFRLNVDPSKLQGLKFGQRVHIKGTQQDNGGIDASDVSAS